MSFSSAGYQLQPVLPELVLAVGAMALGGFGEGFGAAASTGDWDLLGPTFVGHLAQTPAIWALLGSGLAHASSAGSAGFLYGSASPA